VLVKINIGCHNFSHTPIIQERLAGHGNFIAGLFYGMPFFLRPDLFRPEYMVCALYAPGTGVDYKPRAGSEHERFSVPIGYKKIPERKDPVLSFMPGFYRYCFLPEGSPEVFNMHPGQHPNELFFSIN
jgi:hypothetical protein